MRTKIFLVGEAARHADTLSRALPKALQQAAEVVALPREAAHDAAQDNEIGAQDIIVSLRLARGGRPLPPVRLLHVPGAGLDGIDLEAVDPGTTVCNVFEHEGPIAEFVLASLLEWEIGLSTLRASFTPAAWSQIYRNRVPHGEVRDRTLGVLGFGRIGRAIADRARPFGMRILALDAAAPPGGEVLAPDHLPDLLERSDYVVVACPLTEQTRGLIDAAALARMKSVAVLINISRAEIVDEGALYKALSERRIRGASLDVWYRYPKAADDMVEPASHPFHDLPNTICTPHCSAWTHDLMRRRYGVIAENIAALIEGRPLQNIVRAPQREELSHD
jgi:phosphoglycerate dehydrogenase-like enzyme